MRVGTAMMLVLTVVQLSGCARLDTEEVTPAELNALDEAAETGEEKWPSKLRATWPNGTKIVLEETRLEGDTLVGVYCGDVAGRCSRTEKRVALQDLERVEIVTADRRAAHGAGVGAFLVAGAVAIGLLAYTLGTMWQ
jgi:hypothetical protein